MNPFAPVKKTYMFKHDIRYIITPFFDNYKLPFTAVSSIRCTITARDLQREMCFDTALLFLPDMCYNPFYAQRYICIDKNTADRSFSIIGAHLPQRKLCYGALYLRPHSRMGSF